MIPAERPCCQSLGVGMGDRRLRYKGLRPSGNMSKSIPLLTQADVSSFLRHKVTLSLCSVFLAITEHLLTLWLFKSHLRF
jgi:hypothetical protein